MNWETKRIKDIVKVNELTLSDSTNPNYEFKYVDIGSINQFKITDTETTLFFEAPSRARRIVRKNDILVSTVRTYLKAITYIDFDPKDTIASTGFAVMTPKKNINPKFLSYAVEADYFINDVIKESVGTSYPAINSSKLEALSIILPPIETQRKIANYLDAKTQNIDARIELLEKKKKRYITIRKALINEALNGEGKGWKKRRIKELFKIIGSGSTPDSNVESYYDENGYNWLQTGDLNDGIISSTSKKITDSAIQRYSTLKTYKKGSLVVAMYGATIGKVGLLDIDTTTNQACCVMSEPKEIDTKFMFYWFLSNKEFIISRATGGGQPNIGQDTIKFFEIEHPNLDEQQKIVSYLDKKTSAIDLIVSSITKEIDSLKTYRRALINEAVTGKLKIE